MEPAFHKSLHDNLMWQIVKVEKYINLGYIIVNQNFILKFYFFCRYRKRRSIIHNRRQSVLSSYYLAWMYWLRIISIIHRLHIFRTLILLNCYFYRLRTKFLFIKILYWDILSFFVNNIILSTIDICSLFQKHIYIKKASTLCIMQSTGFLIMST